MALYEHARVDWHAEAIPELAHTFGFVLAAAIRKKYEGYLLAV